MQIGPHSKNQRRKRNAREAGSTSIDYEKTNHQQCAQKSGQVGPQLKQTKSCETEKNRQPQACPDPRATDSIHQGPSQGPNPKDDENMKHPETLKPQDRHGPVQTQAK